MFIGVWRGIKALPVVDETLDETTGTDTPPDGQYGERPDALFCRCQTFCRVFRVKSRELILAAPLPALWRYQAPTAMQATAAAPRYFHRGR